jgi:nucleoside-diphosphate-sugar epimerase
MILAVTGLDGFTGIHLKPLAQAQGFSVVSIDADIRNTSALSIAFESAGADFVIHLAGLSFVAHLDTAALYEVNTIGTFNLLQALAALEKRPQKVLIASSATVYGNATDSPISELTIPQPTNHYAMSKFAAEMLAKNFIDKLNIVVARPFNYTGPGQSPLFLVPKLVEHFRQHAPSIQLGNLDVEREFNDVRMVCESYLSLLRSEVRTGCFNICSGRVYKLGHVLSIIGELTNHSIDVLVDPAHVRSDEVKSLCGDPARLTAAIGPLAPYTLENTLHWMLKS